MRVTIGQLTEDYLPHTEKGNKAAEIEVVPRKLVEDIIEYCLKSGEICYDTGMSLCSPTIQERFFARSRVYEAIAQYAHELLERFEGEDA